MQDEISEQFTRSFAKVLNRHGYGFQFSVLKRADQLIRQRKSAWQLEACEFPVESGAGTRIDFVLSRPDNYVSKKHFYLIAECKRSNPALSNWCFAQAPYTHSGASDEKDSDALIMECVTREDAGLLASARQITRVSNIYHLAFEVRSNDKGDPKSESGQAIENAATQVSRSLNGFIQTTVREPQIIAPFTHVEFLPVIFTTAHLHTTNVDLAQADIHTGNLALKKEEVRSASWLFYQYALSPGLKHSVVQKKRGHSIPSLLEYSYLRTIPIVSPSGIEAFLHWSSELRTY